MHHSYADASRARLILARSDENPARREPTSEREYEVDAWVRQADEGRGDRRNVQGELHTSDEP